MAKAKDVWVKTGYNLDQIIKNIEFFKLLKEHPEYFKEAEVIRTSYNGQEELGVLKSIRSDANIAIYYKLNNSKWNYQESESFYFTDEFKIDTNGINLGDRFRIEFNKNIIRGLKLETLERFYETI